jgi:hypothetical protein
MQPPKNSLDIFTPTWFTSVSYLSKDDHRKFVAGTNNHQVLLISEFFLNSKLNEEKDLWCQITQNTPL